jgi:hypothetical protein
MWFKWNWRLLEKLNRQKNIKKKYEQSYFLGFRCAIFTYKGAQVEVVGRTESAYIAQQTPMVGFF